MLPFIQSICQSWTSNIGITDPYLWVRLWYQLCNFEINAFLFLITYCTHHAKSGTAYNSLATAYYDNSTEKDYLRYASLARGYVPFPHFTNNSHPLVVSLHSGFLSLRFIHPSTLYTATTYFRWSRINLNSRNSFTSGPVDYKQPWKSNWPSVTLYHRIRILLCTCEYQARDWNYYPQLGDHKRLASDGMPLIYGSPLL